MEHRRAGARGEQQPAPRRARRSRSAARRPPGRRRGVRAGRLAPEDEQPDQPAEPDASPQRGGASRATSDRPRGDGLRRRARRRRERAAPRPRRAPRPQFGGQLGDRAVLALRAVDPERDPRGDAEQREAELEVDVAAPERRHPEQRHERADVEHRAQRVDRRREVEVDGDRDQAEHATQTTNATETARRLVPSTRRTTGRAIAIRSTNSPIDDITVRNISQRAISSFVVVARRARSFGTGNCGAGPGFGADRERERALHRVPVDRDRAPVDQVPALRQVRAQRHDAACRGSTGERLHRRGRLLAAGGVGDRDDREARLDRLVVGERRPSGGGASEDAAGRRAPS